MNMEFNSFASMMRTLPTDAACREYLEFQRWGNAPVCPHCATVDEKHYKLTVKGEFKGMYKCRSCKQRFTVLLGTIFEGSPIPLHKWFIAVYMFSAHKKGISSHQLARDIKVTQTTAWFMLHRLRETFIEDTNAPLGGEGVIVETDCTIVGGKAKTMSNKKRKAMKGDRGAAMANKTVVTAYVERGGNIRFDVKDPHENEPDLVRTHVDTDSVLMTDTANTYIAVGKEYADHQSVDHSKSEYVRDGYIHTNTIEGAFSHFDRMVIGTYHDISKKHLQAYANEMAFRYNNRKITDKMRFDAALVQTEGVKLPYAVLIAK